MSDDLFTRGLNTLKAVIEEQRAEIERLTRINEQWQEKWNQVNLSYVGRASELAEEIERLLAAISGWRDHYGWKDGEYIDNVNDIFEPLGGKPDHKPNE